MTARTPAELALMTPDELAAWKIGERDAVFGVGHKVRRGKPVENGLGSLEQPTQNSIDAYITNQTTRRAGGPERGFEENLQIMRDNLEKFEAKKAAEAAEAEGREAF